MTEVSSAKAIWHSDASIPGSTLFFAIIYSYQYVTHREFRFCIDHYQAALSRYLGATQHDEYDKAQTNHPSIFLHFSQFRCKYKPFPDNLHHF
jgi:hypothetical protein